VGEDIFKEDVKTTAEYIVKTSKMSDNRWQQEHVLCYATSCWANLQSEQKYRLRVLLFISKHVMGSLSL
jgi:hypothetical protein